MSDTECEVQNFLIASAACPSTSTSNEGSVGEQQVLTILKGKYFSIVPEKSNDKTITGLCQFCLPKRKEIKGQATSTSNFRSHLKRKHFNEFRQYCSESTTKKQSTIGSREEPAKGNQDQFELDVARYVINTMIPLRSVDDPYFRQIFINLGLGAIINTISRRNLGRIVNKIYVDDMANLKNELETVEFVCTTADIWSGRRRSFFGVTAHWISQNFERKSAALACRRFSGVHCFDKIKDLLLNIQAEFGLNREKIVATITDNASNFAKAFRTFGVKESVITPEDEEDSTTSSCLDSSTDEEEDAEEEEEESVAAVNINCITPLLPRHIRCSAHTLNLCITSDMMQMIKTDKELSTLHDEVMQKCNMLWKAAVKPKSAEIMIKVIERTLKRPGETRWNSLYDSLQQIVQIKAKISDLGKQLGFKSNLTEIDFTYLEEHLKCTAPIAEAIDILQGDNVFYGTLLPCLVMLRKKLTGIAESDLKFCKSISRCLLDSLNTRFETYLDFFTKESNYAALAALSHPKFKNRWLGCIPAYQQRKLLDLLKDTVINEVRCNKEYTLTTPPTSNEDKFFDFDNGIVETMAAGYSSIADLEVLHFFQEGSTKYTILDKYPAVKKVFLRYNTPLPSSAPVERLFSYATMTNSPKSNRLSDAMFERRVLLKANQKNQKLD